MLTHFQLGLSQPDNSTRQNSGSRLRNHRFLISGMAVSMTGQAGQNRLEFSLGYRRLRVYLFGEHSGLLLRINPSLNHSMFRLKSFIFFSDFRILKLFLKKILKLATHYEFPFYTIFCLAIFCLLNFNLISFCVF